MAWLAGLSNQRMYSYLFIIFINELIERIVLLKELLEGTLTYQSAGTQAAYIKAHSKCRVWLSHDLGARALTWKAVSSHASTSIGMVSSDCQYIGPSANVPLRPMRVCYARACVYGRAPHRAMRAQTLY